MPSASYHIKDFEHAKYTEPDPNLEEPDNSLAVLHELAWRNQDETALFHKEAVRRDECSLRMEDVQVREHMTVLKWEPNTAFLKMHVVKGILIRDAYCQMIQKVGRILWPKSEEANKSGEEEEEDEEEEEEDIDLDPQYNPFKTDLQPSEEVRCVLVSGGPGIGKSLFMVYVLTLCLLACRPVIWQDKSDRVLVFVDEGVYSAPLHEDPSLYIPKGALYLSDSNPDSLLPNFDFVNELVTLRGVKLLHFAYHRKENIAWLDKLPDLHTTLYMEQCTPEDLICCRDLWYNTLSEQQIEEFVNLYGLSPFSARKYASKLAEFERRIKNRVMSFTKQSLSDTISQVSGVLPASDSEARVSHDIFCIKPESRNAEDYIISIYTRHIYEMIRQRFEELEHQAIGGLLSRYPAV